MCTLARDHLISSRVLQCTLNKPEDFILALVEVDGASTAQPRYVRRPFDKKPGFTEVSVNHDLKKLLDLSEPPS